MVDDEISVLEAATAGLTVEPRGKRWTHLPLCVLDAVFSINLRYRGVVRVCEAYATHAGLPDPLLPADRAHEVVGTDRERPVETLVEIGRAAGADDLARLVLRNRGRTSTRGGVRKAEAALRYAETLAAEGVHRFADVSALLADPVRLAQVETKLQLVPGHGAGVRLSYLWMLTGAENRVKPDRMVLRWLARHLDRVVGATEATALLVALGERTGHSAWELDHAVWQHESSRSRAPRTPTR
ncbi:hypothetical protein KCV87_05035 [Actinosynnema pretiosum subsp. pretiosum]|uniref:Uncharacterized protein n=1 Tax=Actinosynnema pretiosum subsp. pretiosum TaxID=103721 RepID=A0AA45L8V7_9PSEU|nr:hypothetical protein APASM_3016 [Actinosynnema pretiosum subsp. pretiosum]QUF05471.1 hypothetical protein KCV87_05035 [Actinosynnema pretiosum subsp. pretiosum]